MPGLGFYLCGVMLRSLSWFLLTLSSAWLTGQGAVDTTLRIPEVSVTAPSLRGQATGAVVRRYDREALDRLPGVSLADLLGETADVYVKSYGLGSLATAAQRGGAAGHTLVLWNGLPVTSPMLGLLDLSLLPLASADEVTITPGGGSAQWGSGAVGGVIALRGPGRIEEGYRATLGATLGAFDQHDLYGEARYARGKWSGRSTFGHARATNDFTYLPAPGVPERRQTNAARRQEYVGQDLYYRPSATQLLAFNAWWQESERQLPPLVTQRRSLDFQDDRALRLALSYRDDGHAVRYQARAGRFAEAIHYVSPEGGVDAPSDFVTYLGEASAHYDLPGTGHRFLLGTTQQRTTARADGYRGETPVDYRAALFSTWSYHARRWRAQFNLRGEVANGRTVPVLPALGMEYDLTERFTLAARAGRNYRLPTLNDRFWRPGGNPDLLPESGWNQEVTVRCRHRKGPWKTHLSATAYSRVVRDYVLWIPRAGEPFWSANNVARVWSRGVEPFAEVEYTTDEWSVTAQADYAYVRSTNQVALDFPRIEVGDQLLYVPEHRGGVRMSLALKGARLSYHHGWTGGVRGVNEPVPAFSVGTLRASYDRSFGPLATTFFTSLHNVWDRDYFVIERRPVPGRFGRLGVRFSFTRLPRKT